MSSGVHPQAPPFLHVGEEHGTPRRSGPRGSSHFDCVSAKEGPFPREPATAGLPANGFKPELLSSVRVRRISPGPSCPLRLSGAGVCTVSTRGVTLPLGFGDCSCLACCEGCLSAASFLGDLPTIAAKTKKSTATGSLHFQGQSRVGYPALQSFDSKWLLARGPKLGGHCAVLDNLELARHPVCADVEGVGVAGLAAGGGVGLEVGAIELGVVGQQRRCSISGGGFGQLF